MPMAMADRLLSGSTTKSSFLMRLRNAHTCPTWLATFPPEASGCSLRYRSASASRSGMAERSGSSFQPIVTTPFSIAVCSASPYFPARTNHTAMAPSPRTRPFTPMPRAPRSRGCGGVTGIVS